MTENLLSGNNSDFQRCAGCMLLPMIAHDFNNLLTMITGLGESLLSEETGPNRVESGETLIYKAKMLSRIAHAIMELSVSDKRIELTTDEIDPNLLVYSTMNLLNSCDRDRIQIHLPEKLPRILANEDLLHTVLINAFDNAIKYSSENTPIDVAGIHSGKDVIFSVRNQGKVISHVESIEAFNFRYRAENISEKPGYGLGMFIAKTIIDAHHGEIWFEPAPEFGTILFIRIPACDHKA